MIIRAAAQGLARAMWLGPGNVDGAIKQFEHMLNPERSRSEFSLTRNPRERHREGAVRPKNQLVAA